ncbi:alpha-soluble NSF attachment protein-like [Diorhabda carinulata]|uniref:alpha-soluble NSF attachment protein-like n=1 Tax=Diorhabda carinulata TaxID=1163345 RepID=UPI0025A09EBA|nr:alpha-soluble NSF attachment protein-like [Diorhabda carinulata]
MSSNTKKAEELIAEAEKKVTSRGLFSYLFGNSKKKDEALECYRTAAILFKMAKNWSAAGKAFVEVAKLSAKNGDRYDAAIGYVDAANCYKKNDVLDAINCFIKAIEIYTEMGRFAIAAKHYHTIAELYEREIVDLKLAMQYYEQAADYYRGEDNNSSANKCLLKVAQYAAHFGNYEKAVQVYQEVAYLALGNALLQYSAKESLFKAALCHLCIDVFNTQQALESYVKKYPSFNESREYKFLTTLIRHIEEENEEGFSVAIKEYDSVSRLDQWHISILLRIKKQLFDSPDLR